MDNAKAKLTVEIKEGGALYNFELTSNSLLELYSSACRSSVATRAPPRRLDETRYKGRGLTGKVAVLMF